MSTGSKRAELRQGALLQLRERMHSLKRSGPLPGPDGYLATGIAALDQALGGGIAQGKITEFVGRGSNGRTALAVSLAARVSRGLSSNAAPKSSALVAWIDTGNSLDVAGLKRSGAQMNRILWLRGMEPRAAQQALKAVDVLLDSQSFSLVLLDFVDLAFRKVPHQSSWWMRISRKLQLGQSALLVLTREPAVFQPACRVAFSSGRLLDGPLAFHVAHRGCGEVHSFSPVHLRRPSG